MSSNQQKTIFQKTYDGESSVDVYRDVNEAFDARYTPALAELPKDEYGFIKGSFVVSVVWTPEG